MTPEQLAAARATHWRQDAQPLLTLDDATAWIEGMQLALYLPRKAHVLAPAPSFVEAVSGQGSATPAAEAIQLAHGLLVRLVTEGSVVPLNLFGTPGEQPDFLISTQTLSHLAALQGDRNWKKPPSRTGPGKVSPLAIEIWKLLDREGALTAIEIRTQLGHELTEAAVIRGLSELWQNLRVAPIPAEDGEPANWQILSVTHKKEMAAGGTMAQSAALAMLVSNYLQSVVTGTAEDIEAFLSPVASRSRLRDVIRGLTATRQLRSLSMDAQTFLFIDGTLPDMPEVAAVDADGAEAKPAFMGRSAYRERMLNKGKEEETPDQTSGENAGDAAPRAFRPRPSRPDSSRSDRPSAPRRPAGAGASSSFRKRPAAGGDGEKKPFAPRRAFGSRPGGSKPGDSAGGRPPFRRSAAAGGERGGERASYSRPRPDGDRPFTPRSGAGRPAAGGRPAFGRKPGLFKPGADRPGSSRPFTPRPEGRDGEKPSFRPTDFGKSGGYGKDRGKPSFGARSAAGGRSGDAGKRPFRPRAEGDRPRGGSDRPSAGRPSGDRPFTPRPFTPREGGRPPFAGKGRPSFPGKAGSDRAGFDKAGDSRNSSRAGFQSRTGGRPGRPAGDRPRPDRAPGDRPSAGRARPPRSGPPRVEGDRPFTPRPRAGSSDSRGERPRRFDSKPPRREGGSSGYPSNPNRPSRAPKASGSFVKRDGAASSGRPTSGRPTTGRSGGRPATGGGKPPFKPSFKPRSGSGPSAGGFKPGRNPGGTGRPSGPRVGGGSSRPGGTSRPGGASRPGGRPSAPRSGSPKPGGLRPPKRKPRPENSGE